MTVEEAIKILEENGMQLDEDFGIGVGAPCGLDQGIPHGGDGKGCCPQRMGLLFHRSPFSVNPFFAGVPNAHHPQYWLNQIPKKKKKKKKKRKLKESFSVIGTYNDENEKVYEFDDGTYIRENMDGTITVIDENGESRSYLLD